MVGEDRQPDGAFWERFQIFEACYDGDTAVPRFWANTFLPDGAPEGGVDAVGPPFVS